MLLGLLRLLLLRAPGLLLLQIKLLLQCQRKRFVFAQLAAPRGRRRLLGLLLVLWVLWVLRALQGLLGVLGVLLLGILLLLLILVLWVLWLLWLLGLLLELLLLWLLWLLVPHAGARVSVRGRRVGLLGVWVVRLVLSCLLLLLRRLVVRLCRLRRRLLAHSLKPPPQHLATAAQPLHSVHGSDSKVVNHLVCAAPGATTAAC